MATQGSPITATEINTAKSKADTARSTVGVSVFPWAHNPVSVGTSITAAGIAEIRSAVDGAYDALGSTGCSSYDSAYNAARDSYKSSDNGTYDSGDESVCNGYRTSANLSN